MTKGTLDPIPASYPNRPAHTSVPILDAISGRWSPVRFDARRDVAEEDLRGLLEAARWAPSSWGEEPWRFLVARRTDAHRTLMESVLSEGNAYARRASVLIAALAKATFSRNGRANRFSGHDTGLATGALLVEATHRGLITHPMGGFDGEGLRRAFHVPDDFVPMAMIAVGWHDPDLEEESLVRGELRPRSRKALGEIAFGARFGVPLLRSEGR